MVAAAYLSAECYGCPVELRSFTDQSTGAVGLVLLCCLGCSSSGTDDPAIEADAALPSPSKAPLSVDVLVKDTYLTVYVSEPNRPCRCGFERWPTLDKCGYTTDAGYCECAPPPGDCLESVRVERGGQTVAAMENWFGMNTYEGRVTDLFDAAPSELVLEGCGSVARVPLPNAPYPKPMLTGLSVIGDELFVEWSSLIDPPYAFGHVNGGTGGPWCITDKAGPIAMGQSYFIPGRWVFASVTAAELTRYAATGIGDVRVWHSATDARRNIPFPEPSAARK